MWFVLKFKNRDIIYKESSEYCHTPSPYSAPDLVRFTFLPSRSETEQRELLVFLVVHRLVQDEAAGSVGRGAAVQELVLILIDHQLAAFQSVLRFVADRTVQCVVPG